MSVEIGERLRTLMAAAGPNWKLDATDVAHWLDISRDDAQRALDGVTLGSQSADASSTGNEV